MRCTTRLLAAGLALFLALPPPAAANEPFAGMDLVWVRPAAEPGAPRPCARLLLLNLPRDWMVGDAAVAIFAADDATVMLRPLVAALMRQLAAVLEVPPRAVEGCTTAPAEPVAEVLGAVRTLRVDISAGLVVAIGIGAAGPAVLAATREEVAARYLGADGPRLAAGIALDGDRPPAFAVGAQPDGEGWADRAALLCAALASAHDQFRLGACLAGLAVDRPMAGAGRRPRR